MLTSSLPALNRPVPVRPIFTIPRLILYKLGSGLTYFVRVPYGEMEMRPLAFWCPK